jgi:hypothetical protein
MMWDYTAFPLWYVEHPCGGDPQVPSDELALSSDLCRELQAWSDEFTDLAWAEPPCSKPVPTTVVLDWESRGRELVARVRDELGPRFVVGYFNEQAGEIEWPDS